MGFATDARGFLRDQGCPAATMPECVWVRWRWASFLLWRVLHPKWQKAVQPTCRSSIGNLGTRHSMRLILMGDGPPADEYLTETKLSPHTAVILLVQLSA